MCSNTRSSTSESADDALTPAAKEAREKFKTENAAKEAEVAVNSELDEQT